MASTASLPSLNVREAITDVLHRALLGLDTSNKTLFDSAFFPDASFDLNGTVMSGLDAIHTGAYDTVSKLDTTHHISNVRVNVQDGASEASLTATALAQHYREGQGMQGDAARLMAGNLYEVDVAKDESDGLWKIKTWKIKVVWAEGDWGVMTAK